MDVLGKKRRSGQSQSQSQSQSGRVTTRDTKRGTKRKVYPQSCHAVNISYTSLQSLPAIMDLSYPFLVWFNSYLGSMGKNRHND